MVNVLENSYTMTINSNAAQSMINFSDNTFYIILYAIYLEEQGKKIGMSHRKWVGCWLSILGVSYVRELIKREHLLEDEDFEER